MREAQRKQHHTVLEEEINFKKYISSNYLWSNTRRLHIKELTADHRITSQNKLRNIL